MRVILLQDVAKLGRKYAVVSVPDGYAINRLIPKKLAEAATPENLNRLQKVQSTLTKAGEKLAQSIAEAVALLKDKPLEIKAEMNEQGHLFAALHERDIASAMAERGARIEPDLIHIVTPIKSAGSHEFLLRHGDEKATLTLNVVTA